jgi:hypothetical protein
MKGREYLGDTDINIKDSKYAKYSASDWMLLWIEMFGQIDGDHHKAWLLDQLARIKYGTPVVLKCAHWSDLYMEERFSLDKPSEEYLQWVCLMRDGEDGPDTYSYEEGIAP